MRIGKTGGISLVLSGAVLVALGLGPILSAGVADILSSGAVSVATTTIVVTIIALCFSAIGVFLVRQPYIEAVVAAGKSNILLAVAGAIVIATISFVVAQLDNTNSAAWRYAYSVEAGPEFDKSALTEYGHYFAKFRVDASPGSSDLIGTSQVDWATWIAGGESEFLVRVRDLAGPGSSPVCNPDRYLVLSAVSGNQAIGESSIAVSGICNRWEKVQIDLPRGADSLRVSSGWQIKEDSFSVDVMLTGSRVNHSWFWAICAVSALAIVLLLVLTAAVRFRVRESHSAPLVQRENARTSSIYVVAASLIFLLMGNVFVFWFVNQERTIYTWDNAGYWTSTRNVSEFIQGAERKSVVRQATAMNNVAVDQTNQDPGKAVPAPGALPALIRNIRFAEYNVTTSLAIAPVMAVFGGSRMVYELSLLNIYALAAALMLILAVRACGGADATRWPAWWPFVPVLSVLLFTPFWVPLVRGYMGISIVGINLAVLWLYFRQPIKSATTASLITIGLLLVTGVFLQRWNAYWVVGFFLLAFVDSTYEYLRWRGNRRIGLLQCFRAPLVAGFAAFFVFTAIAWPKIVTMVTTDYADIFSAYLEHTSLLMAFIRLVSAFGLILTLIISLSVIYLAAMKSTRRVALLLSIQVIYIFVHLSNTQTMGTHHLYLLMPGILSLVCVAALHSISSDRKSAVIGGSIVSLLFILIGVASGASVFVTSDTRVAKPSSIGIISQDYRPPLVRNDLDEFIRLAKYVDSTLSKEPGDAKLYVLAGSQTLNAEHFSNISASTGIDVNLSDRMLSAAVVDKRDGFPAQILGAQLVVTSIPVQLSRRPSDQQVIRIPAESLISGKNIGAAFERMPASFELDNSVEVLVFLRTRPNTAEEVEELSEEFRRFYPDRPYIYE